jgi:deoxycytidine triphosphate deaminase
MLLNADQVAELLQTNDKGAKAQVGYDLTLKSVSKVGGGIVMKDKTIVHDYMDVTPTFNGYGQYVYHLEPGVYSLTFEQGCKLDSNHTAFVRHRSSVLRCGGIITSGVYDPGFEVEEMGAILFASEKIFIEKGARVAQIIMMENNTAELYNGQWQGSKDVK